MSGKFEWGSTPEELKVKKEEIERAKEVADREREIREVAEKLETVIMHKMDELASIGIGPEGMESALDIAAAYVREKLNELK